MAGTPSIVVPSGFLKAEDLASLLTARWAIYARNGRGKTWFLRSIPPELTFLYVTVGVERGIRAVAHMFRSQSNPKGNLVPYVLNRFNDLQVLLERVDEMIGKGYIHGMAWDTYSRIQDLALGKILQYEPIKAGDERAYIDRIPKNPKGWEGWEQVGALSIEWMRYFNRRPIHQIYLLQENDRSQQNDSDIQTGVRLTPSAFRGVYDDLEMVGRLWVEVGGQDIDALAPIANGETAPAVASPSVQQLLGAVEDPHKKLIDPNLKETRHLFIGAHDRYWVKGNTAVLGRDIVNPTWSKLAASLTPTATNGTAA